MRLDQLLSQIGLYFDRASGVDIRDLTLDSRQVTEGSFLSRFRDRRHMA